MKYFNYFLYFLVYAIVYISLFFISSIPHLLHNNNDDDGT